MADVHGLKGKFVRLDSSGRAVFGSQKRPEWSPMQLQVNPSGLVSGQYYDMDVVNNIIVRCDPLPERGASPSTSGAAPPPPAAIPLQSMMASSTGVVKACLQAGMSTDDAFAAGMKWAHLWMPRKREPAPVPPPAPAPAPIQTMAEQGMTYDEDVPF